jgi:uncharacterized RDD family membrane protein YckC
MAYCTYCGKDISPEARSCPACGQPMGPGLDGRELADWGTRVVAYILDVLVSAIGLLPFVLMGVVVAAAPSSRSGLFDGGAVSGTFAVMLLVVGGLWAIFHKPYFEGRSGQSLGKKATNIKLVREDGSEAGMGLAFGRFAVAWAINLVPFGGLVDDLWPLWDDRKQTLHDKAVKTLVIKV